MKRVAAIARGRGQGVGYRYHVISCANSAGMCGMVRNLPDGTSGIIAEGEEQVLVGFLDQCRAGNDPYIQGDRLDTTWQEPVGTFHSFSLLW